MPVDVTVTNPDSTSATLVGGFTYGEQLWTPAEITTQLWLDDTSHVAVSGAASGWVDKGATGNNYGQSTTGKRPAIISGGLNGLDVLDFNGTSHALTIGSNTVGRNASSLSILFLIRPDSVNSDRRFWNSSHGTGTTNARLLLGFNSSSNYRVGGRRTDAGSYAENTAVSAAGDYGDWVLIEAVFNYADATLTIFRNGVQVSAGAWLDAGTSSDSNSQSGALGANTLGDLFYFDGRMASVVAYHDDTSIDTRQRVEGWALHRFGLTALLPLSHPYKAEPPLVTP